MQVTVYHKERTDDKTDGYEYKKVALVSAPTDEVNAALEYAYRWTQNINDSWSMKMERDGNEDVTVLAPLHVFEGKTYGLRSSMMGDVFEIGGERYEVAMFGFEKI